MTNDPAKADASDLETGQDTSRSVRMFNAMADRLDATKWPVEEEQVHWKESLWRLPKCMLRSLPLALTLICIFQAFSRLVLIWIPGWQPPSITQWETLEVLAGWLMLLSLVIGMRQAQYAEGVLKPNLSMIFGALKANVVWIFFGAMFVGGVHWDDFSTDPDQAWGSVRLGAFFLVLICGNDIKAFKDQTELRKETFS